MYYCTNMYSHVLLNMYYLNNLNYKQFKIGLVFRKFLIIYWNRVLQYFVLNIFEAVLKKLLKLLNSANFFHLLTHFYMCMKLAGVQVFYKCLFKCFTIEYNFSFFTIWLFSIDFYNLLFSNSCVSKVT